MSSEKYIGLDVHQTTISVAVMDSQGKVIMESILEAKASTLLEFLAGLRGSLFVTFEEGTWAAWLYSEWIHRCVRHRVSNRNREQHRGCDYYCGSGSKLGGHHAGWNPSLRDQ